MAIDTYLIGNDGNVSYSIGTNTTVQTFFKVQSFAATLQRPVSTLTAFGDTGQRKRLGMLDLTGSLNAVVGIDSTAGTSSTHTNLILVSSQDTTATRPALSLTLYDGTGTSDAKITSNCVFSSFAFNSAKTGDTTMTVNFENADGVAPVVTWLIA
jgi:hypothetical protein